jgi:hypothetical protein
MIFVKGTHRNYSRGGYTTENAAFECGNCHQFSVATWGHKSNHSDPSMGRIYDTEGPLPPGDAIWNPPPGIGKDFPDIPPHLAAVASEAYLCRNVGALRGAIILARTVIEGTAKHLGCQKNGIAAKLEWMRDEDHIRRKTFAAGDALRLAGNGIAHFDPEDGITLEECDELLLLMENVLYEALEADKRRENAQALRAARQLK